MQGVEHIPTEEKRKLVQTLSAVGITYEDIASKLEIVYHRARQQSITSELIDVINGSNV